MPDHGIWRVRTYSERIQSLVYLEHFTSPHDIPLTWLVAFMLRRHPVPHPTEPTWVQTLYGAQHPLYTWTPDDVQAKATAVVLGLVIFQTRMMSVNEIEMAVMIQ